MAKTGHGHHSDSNCIFKAYNINFITSYFTGQPSITFWCEIKSKSFCTSFCKKNSLCFTKFNLCKEIYVYWKVVTTKRLPKRFWNKICSKFVRSLGSIRGSLVEHHQLLNCGGYALELEQNSDKRRAGIYLITCILSLKKDNDQFQKGMSPSRL